MLYWWSGWVILWWDERVVSFCPSLLFGIPEFISILIGGVGLYFTGRDWYQHRPPTEATKCWSWSQAPRSPRYSGGWPSPLWWWPYSGHICMSWSSISTTWWWGGWSGVSVWPLPWYPSSCPLRWRRGVNVGADEGAHPSTSVFIPLRSTNDILCYKYDTNRKLCILNKCHYLIQHTSTPNTLRTSVLEIVLYCPYIIITINSLLYYTKF